MEIYKARILYEKGTIPKLAKRFGVTENTVRHALRFLTEGEQPELIRTTALQEYGCALIKKPILVKPIEAEIICHESQVPNIKQP